MTKREAYAKIREIVIGNDALVAFVDHEVELLDKRNAAPKAPTAKQIENEGYKDMIMTQLGDSKMTVSEIVDTIFGGAGIEITGQRVSALVTALVNDGKLVRTVEKRKAYFSMA